MTTFTTAVAASSDDAQETSGTVNLTATVLNANSTAQITALRFACRRVGLCFRLCVCHLGRIKRHRK